MLFFNEFKNRRLFHFLNILVVTMAVPLALAVVVRDALHPSMSRAVTPETANDMLEQNIQAILFN